MSNTESYFKYEISDSDIAELQTLESKLAPAYQKLEELVADFNESVQNSELATLLADVSSWHWKRYKEFETILADSKFAGRTGEDVSWLEEFKDAFYLDSDTLGGNNLLELPEAHVHEPLLDGQQSFDAFLKSESSESECGGPVAFTIQNKGDVPKVNEVLWGAMWEELENE